MSESKFSTPIQIETIEVSGGSVRRAIQQTTSQTAQQKPYYHMDDTLDILAAQYREKLQSQIFTYPDIQLIGEEDSSMYIPHAVLAQFLPDGVSQRYPYSSGVACVAYLLETSHQDAEAMFLQAGVHIGETRGHTAPELLSVLATVLTVEKKQYYMQNPDTYLKRGIDPHEDNSSALLSVPVGTFWLCQDAGWTLRTRNGWMNSWVNYPCLEARGEVVDAPAGKAHILILPI